MGEEKAPSLDEIAEAYAKMMGNLMEGFMPICNAITTGLHGFEIKASIKTFADMTGAFVTITYPDRKCGTKDFCYVFDHSGIRRGVKTDKEINEFLTKMAMIIAEDNAIRKGSDGIEKMMQEWEELRNR